MILGVTKVYSVLANVTVVLLGDPENVFFRREVLPAEALLLLADVVAGVFSRRLDAVEEWGRFSGAEAAGLLEWTPESRSRPALDLFSSATIPAAFLEIFFRDP